MTTYTKTAWVNDNPPYLNATDLDKIEQGIADAHSELDTHESDTSNPHSVTAAQAGAEPSGAIATHAALDEGVHGLVKNNLTATAAPAVTDDSLLDYAVKSLWMDQTNGNIYQCLDATAGAAVWKNLTAAASGGGLWTLINKTEITTSVSVVDVTIPSGYVELMIRGSELVFDAGSGGIDLRVSTDGGATWAVGACVLNYIYSGGGPIKLSLSQAALMYVGASTGTSYRGGFGTILRIGSLPIEGITRCSAVRSDSLTASAVSIGVVTQYTSTPDKLRFQAYSGTSYNLTVGTIEVFGR